MAYSDLPAKSSGDVFGLSEYEQIRDNFDAGVPDIFAAKGDLAVATAADAAARLAVGSNDAILVADSGEATGIRWQILPKVIVQNSVVQDPATGSWVALTWDTENKDSHAMHSTASNTSRLTVPSGGAGVYLIGTVIGFNTTPLTAGTSGQYGVRIRTNGTTTGGTVFDEGELQSKDLWMNLLAIGDLSVGHYVECEVWTSQDVDIMTESYFWAARLP